MSDLIANLKEQYDYIVIDTPPIGFVAEYFILMKHMDTNLYVVKHKYTSKDMLTQVNELYAAKKLKNIHMVINDLDFPAGATPWPGAWHSRQLVTPSSEACGRASWVESSVPSSSSCRRRCASPSTAWSARSTPSRTTGAWRSSSAMHHGSLTRCGGR